MVLRGTQVYKNLLHIPTLTSHHEIRSIRFGEPDPSLFRIPAPIGKSLILPLSA